MKSNYALTDIGLYRITNLLDYIFMVGYGTILFSLSILLARRFGKTSKLGKISVIIGICGVIAACCEGIENLFTLVRFSPPTGSPDYDEILHSVFTLIMSISLFIKIALILEIRTTSTIRRI